MVLRTDPPRLPPAWHEYIGVALRQESGDTNLRRSMHDMGPEETERRMIVATLKLFREAAYDTGRSFKGSLWSVAWLLFAMLVTSAASRMLAPMGFAGGFVLGAIHIAMVGWYLSQLRKAVALRAAVTLDDLRGTAGELFWETMSVAFVFFIAQLFLMATPPTIQLGVGLAASLIFNPVPELIYLGRSQSIELLQDAASFMQRQGPEWLLMHLGVTGVLVAGMAALGLGAEPALLVTMIQLFGPFFGFLTAPASVAAATGLSATGLVLALVLFALTHAVMLFRGHLFKRLSSTSRRSRAWQQRVR